MMFRYCKRSLGCQAPVVRQFVFYFGMNGRYDNNSESKTKKKRKDLVSLVQGYPKKRTTKTTT